MSSIDQGGKMDNPSLPKGESQDTKVLHTESPFEGSLRVTDSQGNRLAEIISRTGGTLPGSDEIVPVSFYANAHLPGTEPGKILDAFGQDYPSYERAQQALRDFFEKHGYTFPEQNSLVVKKEDHF